MIYYVDSVVCDYGVYEKHWENDKQVRKLVVICNCRANALLIADILNTDLSNKNYHISELKGENKQSRCNNCQNNTDELSGECYECVKGIEDRYEPLEENKE